MHWVPLRWVFTLACFMLTSWGDVQALEDQPLVSQPLTFRFLQEGFAEGATVSGTFSGIDSDSNGILVHFSLPDNTPNEGPIDFQELTTFSLQFSGNSLVPAFQLTLADLFGFVFETQSGDLGDDPAFDPTLGQDLTEGIGIIGTNYYYATGQGPVNSNGGYIGEQVNGPGGDFVGNALDASGQLMQVTRVPEPATGFCLFAGFCIAGAWRRH